MPLRLIVLVAMGCAVSVGCGDTGSDPGTFVNDGGPDSNGDDGGSDGGSDGGTEEEQCRLLPQGNFNPDQECAWNGPEPGSIHPTADDVVMTPVVVNLTDDNNDNQVTLEDIPDIVFVSYQYQKERFLAGGGKTNICSPALTCGCCNTRGVLRVVSGQCDETGKLPEHFSVGAAEIEASGGPAGIWFDNSGGLAVGDIDADGSVDIVATVTKGGTIALERDGTFKWYSTDPVNNVEHYAATQPSIADIDSDGKPEIVQGRVVLNGEDGTVQWIGTAGIGTNGFLGPVSSLGDIDLSGNLNVLAGNTSYETTGAVQHSFTMPPFLSPCQTSASFPCDGFTATGNFHEDINGELALDDEGEVVIVRSGQIFVLNHDYTSVVHNGATATIAIPGDNCSRNEGGPPTIADFDGDGRPEIGVAGADFYIVADLDCLGSPGPECDSDGILWKVTNNDCTSRVTGSSVFDFDGDGSAEVLYADEEYLQILNGTDGTNKIPPIANSSHTRLEMPIVVDADNDGNAEVIFVENGPSVEPVGGVLPEHQGIRVIGDATDSWVPTRRIWNQHSYHVTNVTELGSIPQNEPVNWLTPTPTGVTIAGVMNNFRQNLPESLLAPDLSVTLEFHPGLCDFRATVCNEGDFFVPPGVLVKFYDESDQSEFSCTNSPVQTTIQLNPGQCETISCDIASSPATNTSVRACVDNEGYDCTSGGVGSNNECEEGNNLDTTSTGNGCSVVE